MDQAGFADPGFADDHGETPTTVLDYLIEQLDQRSGIASHERCHGTHRRGFEADRLVAARLISDFDPAARCPDADGSQRVST
jgi:hypothetical protein